MKSRNCPSIHQNIFITLDPDFANKVEYDHSTVKTFPSIFLNLFPVPLADKVRYLGLQLGKIPLLELHIFNTSDSSLLI